jgi:ABC-type bacteriocin/lantibiotic exporter with double-glycine peptidase domain
MPGVDEHPEHRPFLTTYLLVECFSGDLILIIIISLIIIIIIIIIMGDIIFQPPKEKCPNNINQTDSTCTFFSTITKIKAKRTQ